MAQPRPQLRIFRSSAYTLICGAPHISVYGRHRILNEEPARLAHLVRYVIRPPVALDRVSVIAGGPFSSGVRWSRAGVLT